MAKRFNVTTHEERIQGVFRRAWVEGNGWTAATDVTPLDVLLAEEIAAEELDHEAAGSLHYWPSPEQRDIELEFLKKEEAAAVAAWARRRLIMWIIGDGLHPFHIVQRVYALLYSRYQEFIGPLNMTWLAEILNQGRAAFSAVVKRLFTRPVKIKTGVMILSPGMKSEASRDAYAENAERLTPRRKLDAAHLDEDAEKKATAELRKQQEAQVETARRDYERRKLAEEFGCKPEDIDLDKINLQYD